MLQVRLNLQVNSFPNKVNLSQPVSTAKKHRSQATSQWSLFANAESILNINFIDAILRPN